MPVGYPNLKDRLGSPAAVLGFALAAATVLAALPERWTGPMRCGGAAVLRPGQLGALALRREAHELAVRMQSHFRAASRLAELETERLRLRRENQRLAAELAAVQSQTSQPTDDATDDPQRLLLARCVPAHLLGQQARAFLGRRRLLDVGSNGGVEPEALVVDLPALIDRGSDAQLQPGQMVLSGTRVWGKVIEVGRQTSVVRALTEVGYRDLVRVGKPHGPQGILEGTGRPLARVRLVEVTEPVSVGDPVYTEAGKGVLPAPLVCGRIVRLERPFGAAHWEIWIQPAVAFDALEQVAVLRMELNPLRVAEKTSPSNDRQ